MSQLRNDAAGAVNDPKLPRHLTDVSEFDFRSSCLSLSSVTAEREPGKTMLLPVHVPPVIVLAFNVAGRAFIKHSPDILNLDDAGRHGYAALARAVSVRMVLSAGVKVSFSCTVTNTGTSSAGLTGRSSSRS